MVEEAFKVIIGLDVPEVCDDFVGKLPSLLDEFNGGEDAFGSEEAHNTKGIFVEWVVG